MIIGWARTALPMRAFPRNLPTRPSPTVQRSARQPSRAWWTTPWPAARPLCTSSPRSDAERKHDRPPTLGAKMVESAATTFASIVVLGAGFAIAGYVYHKSYKAIVFAKMRHAFAPGDPVLELAALSKHSSRRDDSSSSSSSSSSSGPDDPDRWIVRDEQARIDAIVAGADVGHYHLLIGEKGTGKSSMLIDAMRKIDGRGVAMFEAHADLEIVRLRLGKALDFEFHEDYIGGYFSERGPRDTTALLDIERALNKLEKVALAHRREVGRPLVLIINQMHLIRDDDDGKDLIELLQQRAEQWAAASLVTMVFNSDDYWVLERLKLLATRMEVHPITDLPRHQAIAALRRYRSRYSSSLSSSSSSAAPHPDDSSIYDQVYNRVGGRLAFLSRVAKADDMLATCDAIIESEKRWFLNNCWILGEEMDDDVMDQQKWASAAMVLALALVDLEREMPTTFDPHRGHILPSFPFHIAQQIQTRSDFIRRLDSLNLFAITSASRVRASSVAMHRAFRDVCAQPGFRTLLTATLDRISAIESLGRTRELVAKDLVQGGRYAIARTPDGRGVEVTLVGGEKDEDAESDGG